MDKKKVIKYRKVVKKLPGEIDKSRCVVKVSIFNVEVMFLVVKYCCQRFKPNSMQLFNV